MTNDFRLIVITANQLFASIADEAGVDWILVDLELKGKVARQIDRNSAISLHTIPDVVSIKKILRHAKLVVRINSINESSQKEIDDVIMSGADIIMLPFFKTSLEVKRFLDFVSGRVKTCLLVETMEAVDQIDRILDISGIDFIHIGLNDLSIQRKTNFMFEFISDGLADKLAEKIRCKKIPFGIGGIGGIGIGIGGIGGIGGSGADLILKPTPEDLITENHRLGSTGFILSRTMISTIVNNIHLQANQNIFLNQIKLIREAIFKSRQADEDFYEKNRIKVWSEIKDVSLQLSIANNKHVQLPNKKKTDLLLRFFDVCLSSLALLFLIPICIPVALILRVTGEGKIFFRQVRIGKSGKEFNVIKFATMLQNSENIGTKDITLHDDPRVLPLGKILRKTKINELPQLFNVIKGDMSLIGPRPQTPRYFIKYPPSTRVVVSSIRPGLSGIGSILFRHEEDMVKGNADPVDFHHSIVVPYKGLVENYYVSNRSLYLYFKLIFLTILAVVFPGNYSQKNLIADLPNPPNELKSFFQ
jgi:lipopolysaccharide/colanic/teichoic acid biosynthesis glycosyltransferase